MTDPRNEFGFEEWAILNISCEHVRRERAAWHAAIDAIRAKLAAKELWIAPMDPDDDMIQAWAMADGREDEWRSMRDSYLAYYGSSFGLES